MRSEFYESYLLEGEQVLFTTDQHAISRIKMHLIVFILILVASLFAIFYFQLLTESQPLSTIILMIGPALIYSMYLLMWRMLLVRRGLVFTNIRLMNFSNTLFSRNVKMIGYNKISQYEFSKSFIGDILNYGSIELSIFDSEKTVQFKKFVRIEKGEVLLNQYTNTGK